MPVLGTVSGCPEQGQGEVEGGKGEEEIGSVGTPKKSLL